MIDGTTIKAKRVAAGIAGHVLCKKLAIARSRLSDIERGYVTASDAELARVDAALEDLIRAQSVLGKRPPPLAGRYRGYREQTPGPALQSGAAEQTREARWDTCAPA